MPTVLLFAQSVSSRVSSSWSWYVIRASGFIALGLLVLIMLSGIGFVTGYSYRFMEPVRAWAVHKALSLALGVAILAHVCALLIDKFVPFTLLQILVPFTKSYTNHATLFGINLTWLAIPAGVLSMYGLFLVILSSLDTVGWISNKKHLWRLVHLISYLTMFLVFIHSLASGTDLKSGWIRGLFEVLLAVLVVACVLRLTRSKTLSKKEPDEPQT